MELLKLQLKSNTEHHKKLHAAYLQFSKLCSELEKRALSDKMVSLINSNISLLNASVKTDKKLRLEIVRIQRSILKTLEKEHKIVTKNHYRNLWLALGMATFGIPLGVVLGTTLGNMGLLGIGLPIGMAIGIAVGTNMDKKALEGGRQLEIEIAY
jgi:hypothetical protein